MLSPTSKQKSVVGVLGEQKAHKEKQRMVPAQTPKQEAKAGNEKLKK